MKETFHKLAVWTSNIVGSAWAFMVALVIVVVWMLSGPVFHFSDTWQLIINTGTTIVTFLMVFLIQNTQARDMKTVHLKLDELVRTSKGARNELVDVEEASDEKIERILEEFRHMDKEHVDTIISRHHARTAKAHNQKAT